MQYCELGWYLAFGLLDASELTTNTTGLIEPLVYRFESDATVHPILLIADENVDLEYWVLDPSPLVPFGRAIELDADSMKRTETENSFAVSFHQDQAISTYQGTMLEEFANGKQVPHLVRGKLNPGSSIQRVQRFVAKSDLKKVPSQIPRGGFQDLFLCLLLGIGPIFLVPESWFLYWLRHQGKLERTRVNPNPLTTKIWPAFCIAVSIFWALSQPGAAKIAALLPFVFGALSLRTQETPGRRVLVAFKKPKKTVRASKAPKS
jgi:hypothetical protein